MYLVKTPWWLRLLGPSLRWEMTGDRAVYLTFDDGPHPTITPFVLQCLQQHDAKATFFCVGENVARYPDTYAQVLSAGHATGNHTHKHVNGWQVKAAGYKNSVDEAAQLIHSKLFRPPYGRITPRQVRALKGFDIVMWNVLSGDFDGDLSPEKCLKNVVNNSKAGSIIVFHDSEKAFKRLEYALPRALEFFAEQGYKMLSL